jgi:hypothetical protein
MKNLILLLTISLTTIQSFAQWTEFVWDIITLEETSEYLKIDTSGQNIWQIGEPSKVFFDSAYSINNAIVTDTLNDYPLNNNSYFELKIGEFNYNYYFPYDVFIEIKHKFDTDTLKDGGFITVSYDEGLTWMNVINDTSGFWDITPYNGMSSGLNLYTENDTLYNGEYGFSGNSAGWVTTWFTWHIMPVKSNREFLGDTMFVRFNFISDNVENSKEGWMIDDIKLYSVDLGGGINENAKLDFKISPNPFSETAIINLNDYRVIDLSLFDIQGKLLRQNKYFNNQSVVINRENLKAGIYFVKIATDDNLIGIKKLVIK